MTEVVECYVIGILKFIRPSEILFNNYSAAPRSGNGPCAAGQIRNGSDDGARNGVDGSAAGVISRMLEQSSVHRPIWPVVSSNRVMVG
eukprot:SAG31_NODE_372_length_16598_cov_44.705982_15_plen_88_part_00